MSLVTGTSTKIGSVSRNTLVTSRRVATSLIAKVASSVCDMDFHPFFFFYFFKDMYHTILKVWFDHYKL